MKRSSMFIAILMTLFMFQSFWNVAAAFCSHENLIELNQPQLNHFGHHQSDLCPQDLQQVAHQHSALDLAQADCSEPHADQISFGDDHQDHLPSFSHFIVIDRFQSTAALSLSAYVDVLQVNWKNLYQSPHLSRQNPPPEYFPLLAG